GGLAAAARADDAQELRRFDAEAHVGNARHAAGRRVVNERDVAQLDVGHTQSFTARTMPQRTTVARSSAPKARRSSAKPMPPITISAASITSALRNSLASKITQPRPQSEAAIISAPITAMKARSSAWRSPAMMKGDAP